MTLTEAKKLYIGAGGHNDHHDSEWEDIRNEMQGIVDAKSDRAAGKTIQWWGCWDKRFTATGFARKVREQTSLQLQPQQQTQIQIQHQYQIQSDNGV